MTCKQRKSQKNLPECQLEMITEKHVIIQWCLLQELSECCIVKIFFFFSHLLRKRWDKSFYIIVFSNNFVCLVLLRSVAVK